MVRIIPIRVVGEFWWWIPTERLNELFNVININTYIKIWDINIWNDLLTSNFKNKLEVLIICFGVIVGLATWTPNGIVFKILFFALLGLLGWDFGMRFFNDNDDDDDFDGGKMIPVMNMS